VLEPLTLIERLCALILRPRHMLVTYHGVLAAAAGDRHRVVPPPPLLEADDPEGCRHQPAPPRGADAEANGAARDDDRTERVEPRPDSRSCRTRRASTAGREQGIRGPN